MAELLDIDGAAQRIARGELVAFPTETVYGLGARADDDAAVARIFERKGRPSDHPLIVHVVDAAAAQAFALELPEVAQRLMQALWPGPLTVIVRRKPDLANAAAGGQPTIGLRCPSHPQAQALMRSAQALGVPGIAAPSANRFGRISPTTAAHVRDEFGDAVPVIDGGACEVGIESAIVDVSRTDGARVRPVLLRPGALTLEILEAAAGMPIERPRDDDTDTPRASGTLTAHYAPRAKLRVMDAAMLRQAMQILGPAGLATLAVYSRGGRSASMVAGSIKHRTMPSSAQAVARELFAVLRELDATGVALIWVEAPPDDPAWDGVRDRLQRAAAGSM
jgi:L-threonylcarbamoyladenylate synthase